MVKARADQAGDTKARTGEGKVVTWQRRLRGVQLKSPEGAVRKQKKEQWKERDRDQKTSREPAGEEAEEQAGPGAGRLTTQFQKNRRAVRRKLQRPLGSTVRVCF